MRETRSSPFLRNQQNHEFNFQLKRAHPDDSSINPALQRKRKISMRSYTEKSTDKRSTYRRYEAKALSKGIIFHMDEFQILGECSAICWEHIPQDFRYSSLDA